MHNGVFKTMRQVTDFYNAEDGGGKGLEVKNQRLSPTQLHLTTDEITALLAFIKSIDEDMAKELPPDYLPLSSNKKLNNGKIGGIY